MSMDYIQISPQNFTFRGNLLISNHSLYSYYYHFIYSDFKEDFIVISSSSSKFAAFKIVLSNPKLFSLSFSEGYLLPFQSVHVPLKLQNLGDNIRQHMHADIFIDLAETENRHISDSAMQFWKRENMSFIRRTIPCDIVLLPSSTTTTGMTSMSIDTVLSLH